jgi:hypothetical protein
VIVTAIGVLLDAFRMHLEATRVISRPCTICSGEVALVSRGCESAFRALAVIAINVIRAGI